MVRAASLVGLVKRIEVSFAPCNNTHVGSRLFLRHLLTPETLSFINIVNSSSIAAPKLDMDFGRIDTDFYLQIVNGKKISIRTENLKESEIDAIFNRYIKKLLEDTS